MITDAERCEGKRWGTYRHHRCDKRWKVERTEGRFCRGCDPVTKREREEAKSEAYSAEYAAEWAHKDALHEVGRQRERVLRACYAAIDRLPAGVWDELQLLEELEDQERAARAHRRAMTEHHERVKRGRRMT